MRVTGEIGSTDTRQKVLRGGAAAALALLLASMAGCGTGGKEAPPSPPPTTSATETFDSPSPTSEEIKIPAEPHITAKELTALTAENSSHYIEVANAHDTEAKGMTQYVVQDPNTTDVKLYTINMPIGTEIESVTQFKLPEYKTDGQITTTGTVINLGANSIEQGEVDARTPQTSVYIFDAANVSPESFAASIDTTPNFVSQTYHVTPADRFKDFWVKPSAEGLYANATWGNKDNTGVHPGEPVGQFTTIENDNRQFDPTQFPDDYESECYFGGQAFYRFDGDDDKTVFITYTFVDGGILEGKIANLNDPAVRALLLDSAKSTNLSEAKSELYNGYAIIRPDGILLSLE
jgi:hypothetical protein